MILFRFMVEREKEREEQGRVGEREKVETSLNGYHQHYC